MKKLLLAAVSVVALTVMSNAQNLGFEDGTTSGWTNSTTTAVGSQTINAGGNTWVINPYGSYMGKVQIQTGTYNQMSSALGLTSNSTTSIQTMLTQQAQVSGGNPTPTTAGWVTQTVTLTAGTQFTLAWQYISVDYVPFNDGSIATLTQNGTNTATVNNYNQQYALLGFTNPGTGDYSTGSYGATGWQVATFDVSVDGTYTLGFGVFNMGDTALSPILFIDELQGTTTKNGQAFGPVAPNAGTSAPAAPGSGGGGSGGGGTPAPTSTVNAGDTAGTGNLASAVTVNGGTIQVATTGITLANTFTVNSDGMTVDQNGKTATFNGVISGNGGVTIANTGTGGGVTFTGINTYTGTTSINSGADLTNSGTIAGAINNSGTFTNSGTAGNTTNSGTATNTGTLGAVSNSGNFTSTGTIGNLNNNNIATLNGNSVTGNITNSGTTNVNGNSSTDDISNIAAGLLNFNGTGGLGTVTNAGTFNFAGSGNTNGINNSGTVNITGAGTTGAITNAGTGTTNVSGSANIASIDNSGNFNLNTTGATIGDVVNSGTWNISGAGGDVAIAGFNQTGTGNLIMSGNQKFNVNGPANLGGSLTINDAPVAIGRYTMISGAPLTGAFDTLTLTNDISPFEAYLKQVGNNMMVFVTPNSNATKASIVSVKDNISDVNSKVINNVSGILGNDCSAPGLFGGCVSLNYGNSNIGSGDLQTGSITLSKAINPNLRVGISMGQGFSQPKSGNTSYKQDMPVTGGFVGINTPFANGSNFDIMISGAAQNGVYTIGRPYVYGAESGSGTAKTSASAYQLKTTYSMPIDPTITVSPYVAIRKSQLDVGGYTEMGPLFPLTVEPYGVSSTDVIAGVGVSKKLTDKLTASAGVGVTQNVAKNTGKMKVSSDIANLNTFESQMNGGKSTSASVGAGLSYEILPGQKIGVNVGWQDKTMLKPASTSIGVSYSFSF